MDRIWIKASGQVGDNVEQAIGAAINAATRLQLGIDLDINGVELPVLPDDDITRVLDLYYRLARIKRR